MEDNKNYEQLKKEYDELKERHEFLVSAIDHLPNPIFMKDENARFFFFNKSYSDFFGMKRRDYIGATVLDLDYLDMEDRKRFQEEDLKAIAEENIVSYDTSFLTQDGKNHPSFYWSRGFKDEYSGLHGLIGEIVDISKERELSESLDKSVEQLKEANEKLQHMAVTDQASGLFNRMVLWDKGTEVIEKSKLNASTSCMIMFDIDYFKSINDDFGHLKGDEILLSFADILRTECRVTDIPIRYGGDEFLLILSDISKNDSLKVAERIRSRVERELVLPDGRSVTISAGLIEMSKKDLEENLSRLDSYLYMAKTQGRNRVVSG